VRTGTLFAIDRDDITGRGIFEFGDIIDLGCAGGWSHFGWLYHQ